MSHPVLREHTLRRAVGEYLEMPGLSLTASQAGRLWGVNEEMAGRLLDELVSRHFLTRNPVGLYVRTEDTAARADKRQVG